jgi:hypothetical protein
LYSRPAAVSCHRKPTAEALPAQWFVEGAPAQGILIMQILIESYTSFKKTKFMYCV